MLCSFGARLSELSSSNFICFKYQWICSRESAYLWFDYKFSLIMKHTKRRFVYWVKRFYIFGFQLSLTSELVSHKPCSLFLSFCVALSLVKDSFAINTCWDWCSKHIRICPCQHFEFLQPRAILCFQNCLQILSIGWPSGVKTETQTGKCSNSPGRKYSLSNCFVLCLSFQSPKAFRSDLESAVGDHRGLFSIIPYQSWSSIK